MKSIPDQLEAVLNSISLKIRKVDYRKVRCITISTGGALSLDNLRQKFFSTPGTAITKYPAILEACQDDGRISEIVGDYAREKNILKEDVSIDVDPIYHTLVLNLDIAHNENKLKFFLSTPEESLSKISGHSYMRTLGISEEEALSKARPAMPDYRPRSPKGINVEKIYTGEKIPIFNTYIAPGWMDYDDSKKPLPDKLPPLFEKLVNHLFPLEIEREFFYCWLHESLFKRSMTFLTLCGPPGTGKNRLKLCCRALHGHQNTVDGKKSTLSEKFNSQLFDNTLCWFDELRYDLDMENTMKEIQNDTLSRERKGHDATGSTKVHSSLVISNNKPRDNYLSFDSRKFVPLLITGKRLDDTMTKEEIDLITKKVSNFESDDYDLRFIAQIGKWIKNHGRKKKWVDAHLEYRGPMFYRLAHTSMSRWQKKVAKLIFEGLTHNNKVIFDKKLGYLWSSVEEVANKKNGDRSLQLPEYSTARTFFDIFLDLEGKRVFETHNLGGSNIMGDFYVKVINAKAKILKDEDLKADEKKVEDIGDDEIEVEEEYDL